MIVVVHFENNDTIIIEGICKVDISVNGYLDLWKNKDSEKPEYCHLIKSVSMESISSVYTYSDQMVKIYEYGREEE